jgi:hypothetical protein
MPTNNSCDYSPTQYTVQAGGANGTLVSVGPGTAGQVLQSGGASSNPAYSTATYPSTAGTSGNILTSNGTNWTSAAMSTIVNVTSPGAYPYTTLSTDQVIIVNTSTAKTINLIASPTTGQYYRIKDVTGTAGTNNITVTPNSGNIDGSASYTINSNYGSIDVVYTGSQWNVL